MPQGRDEWITFVILCAVIAEIGLIGTLLVSAFFGRGG
jgi:hypothetical protein